MNYFEKLNLQQQTHQDFNTLFKETKLVIFLVTSIYINVQFREKKRKLCAVCERVNSRLIFQKNPSSPKQ